MSLINIYFLYKGAKSSISLLISRVRYRQYRELHEYKKETVFLNRYNIIHTEYNKNKHNAMHSAVGGRFHCLRF